MKDTKKKLPEQPIPATKSPMAKLEENMKKGYTPNKAKRRP